MPTLAERLLAGEHHGCRDWNEVAIKLGVSDRQLRAVRKIYADRKQPFSLRPLSNIGKADISHRDVNDCTDVGRRSHAQENSHAHESSAAERQDSSVCTPSAPAAGNRWPSVAEFDAEPIQFSATLDPIPSGFAVHKVSTLIDGQTGEIKQQWIKTRNERDPIADLAAAFASIKDELPRADTPIVAPVSTRERLLAAYLLGDSHVGMHAHWADAGSNFDLKIAEHNLTSLVGQLVDLGPPAKQALIVNIGDYFHSDNRGNTTTKGTPVDVDGRWVKVLAVGIRIMRRIIERALAKHEHVTVINEIGNHDTHASLFLSLALAQFFENEPRVHIDCSPQMFHWYRFGRVLIGTHHGHLVKPADLLGVMVTDRAQDWGETLWRYWFTGHIHHERSREFPGMFWRSLRASSTSDAWHHGQGYRSAQELSVETFDIEDGLINRHMVGVPKNLGRAA
jgi:hypothetical protein